MEKEDVIELAKASGLIGKDYDPAVWDRELVIFATMLQERIKKEEKNGICD